MTYNDPKGEAAASNLFRSVPSPTEDEGRRAVKHVLEHAESPEEAASLLAMLDLHGVAGRMLEERGYELVDDDDGDAA